RRPRRCRRRPLSGVGPDRVVRHRTLRDPDVPRPRRRGPPGGRDGSPRARDRPGLMSPQPIRRTLLLDGDGWQVRPHLGLSAALEAAAIAPASHGTAIHAVHAAADAAAGWLPARVPGSILDDLR